MPTRVPYNWKKTAWKLLYPALAAALLAILDNIIPVLKDHIPVSAYPIAMLVVAAVKDYLKPHYKPAP